MIFYGQVVIGPPGSGKTTYCKEMGTFLTEIGRKVAILNIDPDNDTVCYKASVDVNELITVRDVMEHCKLGPNGAFVYCIKYLEENISWFIDKIKKLNNVDYFLIDCPGQVELYTHYNSIKNIISALEKVNFRFCAVHLVDSHYCSDAGKYISTLLLSLNAMLNLSLPHVNVLSKIDLLIDHGDELAFRPEFYTEVLDLSYLLDTLQEDPFTARYRKLNNALVSLIEDYNLVSFIPLNIKDNKTLMKLKNTIDKATGYIYGNDEEKNIQTLLTAALESKHSNYELDEDVRNAYVMGDPKS